MFAGENFYLQQAKLLTVQFCNCQGIGTPCTELLGALFAWHLYRDYQGIHGGETFGGFDPLGRSRRKWLGPVGVGRAIVGQDGKGCAM